MTLTPAQIPFPSFEVWCRFNNRALTDPKADEAYGAFKEMAGRCLNHTHCFMCEQFFSDANTFTPAGWRETQMSGMCEKCFDEICAEGEG